MKMEFKFKYRDRSGHLRRCVIQAESANKARVQFHKRHPTAKLISYTDPSCRLPSLGEVIAQQPKEEQERILKELKALDCPVELLVCRPTSVEWRPA